MFKYLFFDDQKLYKRENLKRVYGKPNLIGSSVYYDGFIRLTTDNPETPSIISTRENIWSSGELHINISCLNATVAVFESIGDDALGTAHKLEGYSHKACFAFSGDCTNWVP